LWLGLCTIPIRELTVLPRRLAGFNEEKGVEKGREGMEKGGEETPSLPWKQIPGYGLGYNRTQRRHLPNSDDFQYD